MPQYLYRYQSFTRHCMPDDRLARGYVPPSGIIVIEFKAWHVHPAVVTACADLSAGITLSTAVHVDPERHDGPLNFDARFYAVDPELIPEEAPMGHIIGCTGGLAWFEMWIRRDMVDPALVRELNDQVVPAVMPTLVPSGAVSPIA